MFCKQNDVYEMDAIGVAYLAGLYSYALVLSGNRADAEDREFEPVINGPNCLGQRSQASPDTN